MNVEGWSEETAKNEDQERPYEIIIRDTELSISHNLSCFFNIIDVALAPNFDFLRVKINIFKILA